MAGRKKNEPAAGPRRLRRGFNAWHVGQEGQWRGNELWFRRRKVAEIVADGDWPDMWRVKLPDGSLSDMVNRTRAKDAARSLAAIG